MNIRLDTECIFHPVELVNDDELTQMLEVGKELIKVAKSSKNCACLTANQIGISKRVNIIVDHDNPNGYNIYVNADVISGTSQTGFVDGLCINVGTELQTIFVDSISFPQHKLRLGVMPQATVSGFSLISNDREEFEAEGELAHYWQAIQYMFNGVNKDDIVDRDIMTLKGKSKVKPNARCPECGRKFKKCRCEINETILY
ncbi:MAG: hypothetical protein GF411_14370 [Candidatus Lokiarchaeota archaeon]|nr:hypothetical protein [Candidatus Lokiarchaeota archaeon]